MTPSDGADLDPEVLADPVQPDEDSGRTGANDRSEGGTPKAQLVPTSGGGLVPADPFRRYLAELRKYPRLTREEERELARRYRDTGDRAALFRLVTANLMLVVRVAYSFRRAARNMLDLDTQAAEAVEVRVGTTNARRKLLRNLRTEKQRLEEMGYEVGPKLLAEHFGVSEQDVQDVQQALDSRDVSLDEPLGDDEQRRQEDMLADERVVGADETVARSELRKKLGDVGEGEIGPS